MTLPVGTWSVARKQSIRSVGGHAHNLTTLSSSEKKLSLWATRQPFTVEITLLYVFSLSNSLFFVSFFMYPTDHICKSKPGACIRRSTQAVAPSPSHNRDGSENFRVRTFYKRTHHHAQTVRSPKIRERLVVMPRSTARSCRSMSSYGRVLATSWRVLAARLEPVYFFRSNLCRFSSKFAWALPFSLSSP